MLGFMKTYVPINCSYYDELEAIATLKKAVQIIYWEKDQKQSLQAVQIRDLFTKNKEEFVVLDNGQQIRLDYLIEVDGKPVIYGC